MERVWPLKKLRFSPLDAHIDSYHNFLAESKMKNLEWVLQDGSNSEKDPLLIAQALHKNTLLLYQAKGTQLVTIVSWGLQICSCIHWLYEVVIVTIDGLYKHI